MTIVEDIQKNQRFLVCSEIKSLASQKSKGDFSGSQKSEISEKSLFVEFMGDSPMIKVMDYLITERELDFSITDMAENAGIGRATLYRLWDDLIKNEIIFHTRDIGKAKLFKLNTANTKMKKLIEIYDMLVIEELKKHSEYKKIEVSA